MATSAKVPHLTAPNTTAHPVVSYLTASAHANTRPAGTPSGTHPAAGYSAVRHPAAATSGAARHLIATAHDATGHAATTIHGTTAHPAARHPTATTHSAASHPAAAI
eukprot:CAMPEP_0181205842 /NCGR_PEP_ID=MMETSP1096-20121128/20697_1 /TAXON_ID=156174 ORGANISM="Chrysochromulina ericina, Strain CCMP281" /NCGR_SAMPLE_ID=MMETSP1096 /ASSEMBLY_ACC=CAM_ASM_000453 /LENGTH=106 /DNA_ID=CAMNT_0023296661 /DNA_START=339 /DNA_END=659 /DNA_ORIENTATION=-